MHKPSFTLRLVAVLAGATVVGIVFSSNMGFRVLRELIAPDGGVQSLSGRNALCLPYQPGLATAEDLIQDIDTQAGGSSTVAVERFLPESDTVLSYDGTVPADNFALEPGVGYTVVVSADVAYYLVGSHDHQARVNMFGPDHPSSLSGRNRYCAPYHAAASTASELAEEIDRFAGGSAVIAVTKFLASSDGAVVYVGLNKANDFPLEPGMAYEIQLGTSVDYIPALR